MGQIMETASSREDQGPIFGATTPTWEGKQSEKVKKIKIKITPTQQKNKAFRLWILAFSEGAKGILQSTLAGWGWVEEQERHGTEVLSLKHLSNELG